MQKYIKSHIHLEKPYRYKKEERFTEKTFIIQTCRQLYKEAYFYIGSHLLYLYKKTFNTGTDTDTVTGRRRGTHTHTHTCTFMDVIHWCTHTYTCVHTPHARTHTHTHHTHTHTTHTHTHTHIYIYICIYTKAYIYTLKYVIKEWKIEIWWVKHWHRRTDRQSWTMEDGQRRKQTQI
jgi:hypothetical protein